MVRSDLPFKKFFSGRLAPALVCPRARAQRARQDAAAAAGRPPYDRQACHRQAAAGCASAIPAARRLCGRPVRPCPPRAAPRRLLRLGFWER